MMTTIERFYYYYSQNC